MNDKSSLGGSSNNRGESAYPTDDGGYIITGWRYGYADGAYDVWLIKAGAPGVLSGGYR